MKSKLKALIVFLALILMAALSVFFSAISWNDFLNYFDFWKHTLILGGLLSFVLGGAGFWLVAKQSVYSGLSLSASSIVGLMLAAFCFDRFMIPDSTGYLIIVIGIFLGVAIYLTGTRFFSRRTTNDAATAAIYVACTAITIILSNNVAQGHHELENLLFGNSVTVTEGDYEFGLCVSFFLILLGVGFSYKWLHLVFDPLFEYMSNKRARLQNFLLQLFIAFALIVAAKNFGMLTTFALMLFPALTAYGMGQSGIKTYLLAAIIAALVFPLGFIVSFFLDQPTGACICLVGFIVLCCEYLIEAVTA
jgi:ABC-type Mn2+/Zn2+ transport system permease subunit